jgi:hypothetical protein
MKYHSNLRYGSMKESGYQVMSIVLPSHVYRTKTETSKARMGAKEEPSMKPARHIPIN